MKQRIAVIGGGVGAITAVWGLTQVPDWQQRYEITVYQLGWRLGGKGASGRNMAQGARIEEHGLHVWAGFYQNAFHHMRACYGELGTLGLRAPDAPLGTFDQAFKPLGHVFLTERIGTEWRPWVIDLPVDGTLPGDATETPGPWEIFRRAMRTIALFLENGSFTNKVAAIDPEVAKRLQSVRRAHAVLTTHVHAMPDDPRDHLGSHLTILSRLVRDAQAIVHAEMTPESLSHDGTRRALYLADLALAYARGTAESDTFTKGYDGLDQWEFTDWLRRNGAREESLSSVILRACYDFVFGFRAGDIHRPDAGAGTAVRAMGRLILDYDGAIFWKMQAGMGDTIFAPYYQVLRARGVRFEFFSAARALHPDGAGAGISSIDMVRQAEVTSGTYEPLVTVKGLPCWPSEPLWDQLSDANRLRSSEASLEAEPPTGAPFTLTRGRDFDQVILGASLGSLPYLTKELSALSPRWRAMLREVRTVGTHAAQFWLTQSADALGWRGQVTPHNADGAVPPNPMQTMLTGFAEPLDTWADMSHLLPREDWPGEGPASVAYFCAPAPDGETLDQFRATLALWAKDALPALWPGVATDAPYYPPGGGIDDQYARVNMDGSERYVLSVAGSVYHRLAPDESGFDNLVLAGDWTRCGLNAGCVEAATMSGLAAANATMRLVALDARAETSKAALPAPAPLPITGADDIPAANRAMSDAIYRTASATGASWPLDAFYAKGKMTGWFLFHALPRNEVAAMLPKGLHLGTSSRVAPGLHPMGMSFCRYHGVRGSFVPDFLAMAPYGEATFGIPDVLSDRTGRAGLLYPRRLYVDNRAAIFAGRTFYAMNKMPATIEMDERSFTATAPGLDLTARYEQRSDPVAASAHPAFGAIRDMLGTTFVTCGSSGGQYFNAFNLELDRAWIAPAGGHVRTSDTTPGGFAACDFAVPALAPGPTQALPGAFRIWCSWSMTNPVDSARVAMAAKARAWLAETY